MSAISSFASQQGRYASEFSKTVDDYIERHADEIHLLAKNLVSELSDCSLSDEKLKELITKKVTGKMPDLNDANMKQLRHSVITSIFCSI